MIRINLLPFRAARRKENIRRQVSVFVLMIVLFVVGLVYYTIHIDRKTDRIRSDVTSVNSRISLYKEKADKVTRIKKNLAILERKLDIVKSLELKRREPVELFDAMTSLIVPKRMWLTSLKTAETTVLLSGIALDNKTVADFMTRLETSRLFTSVDLKTLRMKMFDKAIQMKEFELICHKTIPNTQDKPGKVKK
ncbi:MAG: pilus assembly protein PilN [Desulfobacteraceae bacterium]|nr:pilus assembly protein PilN [Desulfobacteraceae bacterium]